MKKFRKAMAMIAIVAACLGFGITSNAAGVTDPYGTMSGANAMPGVTFATENGDGDGDLSGMFITTDKYATSFGDDDYQNGDRIYTGVTATPVTAGVGQHLYKYDVEGPIQIAYWTLTHYWSQCIHNTYPTENFDLWERSLTANGVKSYVTAICREYYNGITRGWFGTCADCGEELQFLVYMTPETAKTFSHLDTRYYYYYLCPFNKNLEQEVPMSHKCKAVSYNKYFVKYIKNATNVSGYMPSTTHMYNNVSEYEGDPIVAQTSLRKNVYARIGYKFVGWNTKADGSGEWFADEQEILNLTDIDQEYIFLYAQWQLCDNPLTVIADGDGEEDDGALYNGKASYDYTVSYGGTQNVTKSLVTPPAGYTVVFDTVGGTISGMANTSLTNVSGTQGKTVKTVKDVSEWTINFAGTNSYMDYSGTDGTFHNEVDADFSHTIRVGYSDEPFTLPGCSKSGMVFAGWKLISGSITNKPTLAEGASVTPSSNMADNKVIRYQAVYASMTATVVENYEARNMKGAADLTWGWNMALSQPVFYKVYRDGTQISGSSGDNANLSYSAVVNTSGTQTGTYTVKTAGTYRLEAAGAKGGDNGSVKGGSGALVKGTIWLNEGDKIVYRTQNSSYAGGTGDTSGGAATTISLIRAGSSTEQLIMVAAGGGGATPTKTGGSATAITTATSTSHKGASGAYGGGGGEPGGNAGAYVVHHHTDDCYITVDTSFVLMDRETDYLSPWAQSYLAYGQDMLGNGYRYNFDNAGDYYDGRTNNYGIYHHGRDTASGGLIFLGRIHYAEEPHYRFFDIPVNGNKYLNLHLSSDYWGPTPNSQFNTSVVTVYNQNGEVIFSKNLTDIPRAITGQYDIDISYNDELDALTGGGPKGTSSAWAQKAIRAGEGVMDVGQIYWNEKVAIPDGTTGVRIEYWTEGNRMGWFTHQIESISFEGTSTSLICGMTEGQVIDNTASSGGTSYYNSSVVNYEGIASNSGNGSFKLTPVSIGFDSNTSLDGALATDLAAPDKPAAEIKNVDRTGTTGKATISISKPEDHGTTYKFQVEAFSVANASASLGGKTNTVPETVTLTTGVKGYRIGVFDARHTGISCKDGTFYENGSKLTAGTTADKVLTVIKAAKGSQKNITSDADVTYDVPLKTTTQYVYIFAVDFAGNCSAATELIIPAEPVDVPQKWPVYTRKLEITGDGSGNVYKASGYPNSVSWSGSNTIPTYFVRADGTAPFYISGTGYTTSKAEDDQFLVNKLSYKMYNADTVSAPSVPGLKYEFNADGTTYDTWIDTDFKVPYSGTEYFGDIGNTIYKRSISGSNKLVELQQGYVANGDMDATKIYIYPEATGTVLKNGEKVLSTDTADRKNGIIVIPDGEGPVVDDTDIIELITKYQDNTINQDGEYPYEFTIPVDDLLSGVAQTDDGVGDITVIIRNLDNGSTKEYHPEDTSDPNVVKITFDQDDALFSGEIEITVISKDNVGNETTKVYTTDAFGVYAELEYSDALVDGDKKHNYFLTEDHGKLKLEVTGYVDKIEVTATANGKDIIDFDDGTNNKVSISFNGDTSCDIVKEHPEIKYNVDLPFTVDGKLPNDTEITYTIKVTKGGKTTTETVTAKYLVDRLTPVLDDVKALTTNAVGIPNVFKASSIAGYPDQTTDNTYYVKADGTSAFSVEHTVQSSQLARKTAQINIFDLKMEILGNGSSGSYLSDYLDNVTTGTDGQEMKYHYIAYNKNAPAEDIHNAHGMALSGTEILSYVKPKTSINRVTTLKDLDTAVAFTADPSLGGSTVQVTPKADMDYQEIGDSITSGYTTSASAFLILDANGPDWTGDEGLDQKILTPGTPEDVTLDFTDDLSGLNKVIITIKNETTGEEDEYVVTPDNPRITITIDPDSDQWIGVTKITVTGYDNVGNETEKTYTVFSFNVDAKVTTTYKPFTNVFYSGNRGWLLVETWGYVESLDITFPDDLHPKFYVYQDGDTLGKFEFEDTPDPDTGAISFKKNYTSTDENGKPQLPQTVHIQLDDNPNHYSAHRIDLVEFEIADVQGLDPEYTINVVANKRGYTRTADPVLYIIGYTGDLSRTRLR